MTVIVQKHVLIDAMRRALKRDDKEEFDRLFDATDAALERKLGPPMNALNDPRVRA